jgi:hypothetical protein
MSEISEWSDETFGNGQRNPAIAYHLKKEINELIQALEKKKLFDEDDSISVEEYMKHIHKTSFEFADCFMLLLDSATHYGITAYELFDVTRQKLEINRKRKWGVPDENGVVEHLEE